MTKYKYDSRILIIDDDEGDQFLIKEYLSEIKDNDFTIDWMESYDKALETIKKNKHDIYLVDYYLGANTGLDLIQAAIAAGNDKPFILLTGLDSHEVDVKAIRAGAYDYLPKNVLNSVSLERAVRHSLERYDQYIQTESQKQRFFTLFQQSIDPLYITDDNFGFKEVNPSFLSLFKYKQRDIHSMNFKEIFVDPKAFKELQEKIKEEGYVQDLVAQLKDVDGNEISALISASYIKSTRGQLTGYQGFIHDLTEIKEAEQQVLSAEKISLSGRMARMIGHEVRNPLTNIQLSADQLKDEIDTSNQDAELFLDMIKRNAVRISNMIDELLNSTRTRDLELVEVDLNQILSSAIEFCNDRFNLKNIEVIYSRSKEEAIARVDKEQLKIAFINIMTNAVEAMEGVEKGVLSVNLDKKPAAYKVLIKDNGKGMDEDTRKHLFDPFYSKRSGGMGLGMTSVNNIILAHKGRIFVESEEEKGTNFHIFLPTK